MTTQPSTGPRPRTEAGRRLIAARPDLALLTTGRVVNAANEYAVQAVEAEARAAALTAVEEAVRAEREFVVDPDGVTRYWDGVNTTFARVLAVLAKLQEDEQ